MYKERVRKILSGLLVLCMVFAMSGFASVSAAKKVAATKVKITNAYTVMAVGQSANFNSKLTPSKSTDTVTWTSSNKSIANPDANGKFTAKKSGTVTITATATSGAKASVKVLVVSKNGVTSLQTRINKMLKASNIKKITIKNLKTAENYTIAAGDYSKKTLTINAPYSDVVNNGKFKKVVINAVKNGTYVDEASGNSIINNSSDEIKIVVGKLLYNLTNNGNGGTLNLINNGKITKMFATDNSTINLGGTGTVKNFTANSDVNFNVGSNSTVNNIKITEGAGNVTLNVDGTVKKVIVTAPTNIIVGGNSDTPIEIVFAAGSEGSTITASTPVAITSSVAITAIFEEGSAVSSFNSSVESTVINNSGVDLTITNNGITETVESTVTDTTTTTNNTGSYVGSTTVIGAATATVSGSAVVFTLPTAFDNVKTASVNVSVAGISKTYELTSESLTKVKVALAGDATTIANWSNVTTKTVTGDSLTVTVEATDVASTKNVTFSDGTVSLSVLVSITGTTGNDAAITVTSGANSYVLTKSSDNKTLIISGSNADAIKNMVSFTITY